MIVTSFSDYFSVSFSSTTSSNINNRNSRQCSQKLLYISDTSDDNIISTTKRLKSIMTMSTDGIYVFSVGLRLCCFSIALTIIFNLILRRCTFRNRSKLSKIISNFKKSSRFDITSKFQKGIWNMTKRICVQIYL